MDLSIDWGWLSDHTEAMVERFWQHLQLVIIPVAVGFVIALVLAIWVYRRPRVYAPMTAVTGLLYTIPSLAAFAFLVPITGLSLVTALIPLTTYTLLILLRADVAGLQAVPPDVLESAEGMGYTRRQRLWRIEVPLALPLMMAGLRLATVSTIGLATVASIIGETFGGFGYFITEGVSRFFMTEIVLGAVLSIILAVVADVLLIQLEKLVTPWARARARAR
ncbi:MAG: ABC transporter permease [Chloroflexota bacterium]